MKFTLKLALLLAIFTFLCSCSETSKKPEKEVKEIDPFEAAMPHGTSLPEEKLSEADQIKLSKAIGKSVQEISYQELLAQFEAAYGKLSIISFWKLDCASCKEVNLSLQRIQHELGNDKLDLSMVSLDSVQHNPKINTYIRANNFTSNVYRLKENRPKDWKKQIVRSWEGELPGLYLINKADGTDFFYQQEMSYEELLTVIQSLVI